MRDKARDAGAALAGAVLLAVLVAPGVAGAQSSDYEIPLPPAPPAAPALMDPFPTVRTAGTFTRKRTRFRRVLVTAPAGARIVARCSKRRCRPVDRTLERARTVRLRGLQRRYKAGTRIRIRITAPDVIGKYVEIRTRKGQRPRRRDRCLVPGTRAPQACESP